MNHDGVIVLHGIFRSHRSMARLTRFLKKNGYQVLNIHYPSTRMTIDALARHIKPAIDQFAAGITGKLHFVGYSMGGLIIRSYIRQFKPHNLGRVVMLGTPNQGSEVADTVKNWKLYKWIYGPAGQQLTTGLPDAHELFGTVDYELGSIAGNFSLDPIFSRIMGGPNDGKVSVKSTKLDGMKDHIVISASHTFFPTNHTAWKQALHFLQNGIFHHPRKEIT